MRQFREQVRYSDDLKDAPRGVCKTCGGEGRYRVTYKYKAPIIHKCILCSGTGKVKVKVVPVERKFREDSLFLVSENETTYTVSDLRGNLAQLSKEDYLIEGEGYDGR